MDKVETMIDNKINEESQPKRLFKHDIPPEIFNMIRKIFNYISRRHLIILLIILAFSLIFQQWFMIMPVIVSLIPVYLIFLFGQWFILNYKNIKIKKIKERKNTQLSVYEVSIDKDNK